MLNRLLNATAADWIIAPNHRSALAIQRGLQAKASTAHYRLPTCLSEEALLQRLWTSWQQHCPSEQLSTCLTPIAERALWLEIMGQDVPQAEANQLVATVMQAWQLQHDWLCPPSLLQTADGLAQTRYSRWQRLFQQSLQQLRCLTLCELPARLLPIRHPVLPKQMYRIEPLFLKPSLARLLLSLGEQGLPPITCQANKVARVSSISVVDERAALDQAVQWAGEQVASGAGSIAVVVPQLKQTHQAVKHAFESAGLDCNISAGHSLLDYPLVAHTINLLMCLQDPSEASLLTLSQNPFLIPDPHTAAQLHQSHQTACSQQRPWHSAPKLFHEWLQLDFYSLAKPFSRQRNCTAADWVAEIEQLFKLLAYPRGQLDSAAFQLWQRLLASLQQLPSLDWIKSSWTFTNLVAHWQAALRQQQFQAEGSEAKVQILGLFESLNIEFDRMLVMGLAQGVLPERSSANAFLPLAWQLQVPVGKSSDLACEQRAADLLRHWARHNDTLCLQFQTVADKRSASEHPILQDFLQATAATVAKVAPEPKTKSLTLETVCDTQGLALDLSKDKPVLQEAARRFEHQAQCAFKAYATHRLDLSDRATRSLALTALQRGTLQHSLLHHLLPSKDIEQSISQLSEPYLPAETTWLWPLEQDILRQLASLFLLEEARREPYEIAALEQAVDYQLDGVSMRFRVDRIDRLSDGTYAVIDYKSGRLPSKKTILSSVDKPQLALYSLTLNHHGDYPISAVAFFSTHPDNWGYLCVGEGNELMFASSNKKDSDSISSLNQRWRSLLRQVLAQHLAGDAAVAPTSDTHCQHCHLQALCRYQLDRV